MTMKPSEAKVHGETAGSAASAQFSGGRLPGVDQDGADGDEGKLCGERLRHGGEKSVASAEYDEHGGRHDERAGRAGDAAEDFERPEKAYPASAEPAVARDETFAGIDRIGGSEQEERIVVSGSASRRRACAEPFAVILSIERRKCRRQLRSP